MMFYRIQFDSSVSTYWFIDEPIDLNGNTVDARVFTTGNEYTSHNILELPINKQHEGDPADFTLAAFDMPVVKKNICELIEKKNCRIQRIPARLNSSNNKYCDYISQYDIANFTDSVSCIDKEKSVYTVWSEEDGIPDKVGQYRMIVDLKINSTIAKGHNIFRIKEWPIALIVSEELKYEFEKIRVTGIEFFPVV